MRELILGLIGVGAKDLWAGGAGSADVIWTVLDNQLLAGILAGYSKLDWGAISLFVCLFL